jgi:hypothetical protein
LVVIVQGIAVVTEMPPVAMTSNTTPAPYAVGTSGDAAASAGGWEASADSDSYDWRAAAATPWFIAVNLATPQPIVGMTWKNYDASWHLQDFAVFGGAPAAGLVRRAGDRRRLAIYRACWLRPCAGRLVRGGQRADG